MTKKNSDLENFDMRINSMFTADAGAISKERWDAILQFKYRFLNNNDDPYNCPYINQEVAASWIRSRHMGVDPYGGVERSPRVDRQTMIEIRKNNELLINVTQAVLKTTSNMIELSHCGIYLIDKSGVLLFQEGAWPNVASLFQLNPEACAFPSENDLGTTAHTLSFYHKRPVILLGPEHYCVAYKNNVAFAAPVFDEHNEVTATLACLSLPFEDQDWGKKTFQQMCFHTFGVINTMAVAIGVQTKLEKQCISLKMTGRHLEAVSSDLRVAYNFLEATMSSVDDGLVHVDQTGRIVRINEKGKRALKIQDNEVKDININQFLSNKSYFMDLAARWERDKSEDIIYVTNNDHQLYPANIWPIWTPTARQFEGAVIRINNLEQKSMNMNNNHTKGMLNYVFEDIVGESPAIKKAIALGRRFADSSENVLIIGESGTGKELFAQAIHNQYRPQGPFIAVNCAAMPRELIESELFGYEGGSFTGADRSGRSGKIELANGGTLFLDEIGDMSLDLQAVLLRVLEDKQVMRVGGRTYRKVDFRVIAATNKNLYKMVEEKLFREDLNFRLAVLSINLPPLRERTNDPEILCRYFIKKYCEKRNRQALSIHPLALKKINDYNWPGNVRQLENAMIYAMNISPNDSIRFENLPEHIIDKYSYLKMDGKNTNSQDMIYLKDFERAAIEIALSRSSNDIVQAANILNISRATIYRKVKEYDIDL